MKTGVHGAKIKMLQITYQEIKEVLEDKKKAWCFLLFLCCLDIWLKYGFCVHVYIGTYVPIAHSVYFRIIFTKSLH